MKQGRATFALVTAVLAFLLTASVLQERSRSEVVEGRRSDLMRLLSARQARAVDLENELQGLTARAARLAAQLRGSAAARVEEAVRRLAPAAGTEAVSGPAVMVALTDSPLAERGTRNESDFLVQDVDLQAVVNELWRVGAEAIAINGRRIVSTTAIRSAGGAILVNYRVLVSPYRIVAVGDADAMSARFRSSAVAQRFRAWSDVYGLGFSISTRERVTVPAFAGAVSFRYARPAM